MRLNLLPNVISGLRLATTPILAWLALADEPRAFFILLVAAGSTDLLDGWLARRFGWTSRLGALLDSAADVAIVLVAILGVWRFHAAVVRDQWPLLAALVLVWALVHVIALVRYRRLASFHTRSARVGMALFGLFVIILFAHGPEPWFLVLTLLVCIGAGVENLWLVCRRERPGPIPDDRSA